MFEPSACHHRRDLPPYHRYLWCGYLTGTPIGYLGLDLEQWSVATMRVTRGLYFELRFSEMNDILKRCVGGGRAVVLSARFKFTAHEVFLLNWVCKCDARSNSALGRLWSFCDVCMLCCLQGIWIIHCRYVDKEDRELDFSERNDDTNHYITYDAFRRVLFINPSVEVLTADEVASPENLAEWFHKTLYEKRGIYMAPAASPAKRVRLVMLETWRPESAQCTGYNLHHLLPSR